MCRLGDGTLLAVWRLGTQHAGGQPTAGADKGVLVLASSTDNGLTWTAGSTIYTDATYDARDPNLMVTAAGTVICSFFLSDATTAATIGLRVIRSTDNGATWGAPVTLNPGFTSAQAMSSPPVQLSTGKLLQAVYGADIGNGATWTKVITSTDDGLTWGSTVTLGAYLNGNDQMEPNLVVVNDALVVAMTRCALGADKTMDRAVSTDGGLTWSARTSVIGPSGSPSASPRLCRTAAGLLVYLGRETTGAGGSRAVLRTSGDNGVTWKQADEVDPQAYSDMIYGAVIETSSRHLCVLYSVEKTFQADGYVYAKQVLIAA